MRNGISPMPTAPKTKRRLLQALPDEFEGKIVELGSGWATLAAPLANKYPRARVVGYETSPIPYYFSKLHRAPNLSFERRDFFDVPLSDAGMVICYLYPAAMKRLKDKFANELLPGTVVVSHTFAVPGWVPEKTVQVKDLYNTVIYFYRT